MQAGTLWYIGGTIFVAVGGLMFWKASMVNNDYREEQTKNEFKAIITDQKNQLLSGFAGINILEEKVEDTNKGYLRIKIHADYLNSAFSTPVILKNAFDKYQPISLLCDSDPERGPGIFVVIPNKEFRTVFYLTDFLKFENLGKLIYVEDFVFDIFYNDISVYFVTYSWKMKFEPTASIMTKIGPIKLGPNLITRPYDNKSYQPAMYKFPDLATHFNKDYSNYLTDLYETAKNLQSNKK